VYTTVGTQEKRDFIKKQFPQVLELSWRNCKQSGYLPHSAKNLLHYHLLSISMRITVRNCDFEYCFLWKENIVLHTEGKTLTEGVSE
jgi:phosphopantetheinyl transferase